MNYFKHGNTWVDETSHKAFEITRKGGTRKIADAPPLPCPHPEHNPPSMMVFEPGVWEHICPMCGKRQIFRVNRAYL